MCNVPRALKINWLFQKVPSMLPKPTEAITVINTRVADRSHQTIFNFLGTNLTTFLLLCIYLWSNETEISELQE